MPLIHSESQPIDEYPPISLTVTRAFTFICNVSDAKKKKKKKKKNDVTQSNDVFKNKS